jgi:hypothetical protein
MSLVSDATQAIMQDKWPASYAWPLHATSCMLTISHGNPEKKYHASISMACRYDQIFGGAAGRGAQMCICESKNRTKISKYAHPVCDCCGQLRVLHLTTSPSRLPCPAATGSLTLTSISHSYNRATAWVGAPDSCKGYKRPVPLLIALQYCI